MCELFGINGAGAVDASAWLETFFTHGNKNPHGWGMALFQNDPSGHAGFGTIEKEPVRADKSAYLRARLHQKLPAASLIAHVREATIGSMEYRNTHPFQLRDQSGRCWTLAHNGTVFESRALRKYIDRQEGQTDSERILYYLVDKVNEALDDKRGRFLPGKMVSAEAADGSGRSGEQALHVFGGFPQDPACPGTPFYECPVTDCGWNPGLTAQERCRVVDEAVRALSPENKLNLLVYDGEILYAHTNLHRTLYRCNPGNVLLFATVPFLTGTCATWEEMPFTSLCAYRDGAQIYQGAPHGFGYVEDPEKIRSLMMAYAAL